MSSNSDSNDEQSNVSISNTDSGSELEYESDENCMYGNELEYTPEELLDMGEATDDFADSEDSDADSSLLDNSRLENLHWCYEFYHKHVYEGEVQSTDCFIL